MKMQVSKFGTPKFSAMGPEEHYSSDEQRPETDAVALIHSRTPLLGTAAK